MGNLGRKSADSASVEDGSPLLQLHLDLPPTLLRDPSAGREQTILNAFGAAHSARAPEALFTQSAFRLIASEGVAAGCSYKKKKTVAKPLVLQRLLFQIG